MILAHTLLTSLGLSSLIYEIGIIIVPPPPGCCELLIIHVQELLMKSNSLTPSLSVTSP